MGAPRPSGVTAGVSPEALFAAATHQSPLGHALVELDGTFHDVNLAFCAITGYSTDELVGMTFQEITHPDDVDADVSQVESLAAGEIPSYVMEKRYIRKDSSVIWVRLFVSILRDSDGDPLMFVAQVRRLRRKNSLRPLSENARSSIGSSPPTLPILWSARVMDALHLCPHL